MLRHKPTHILPQNIAERSSHSFLLSIRWINLFKHLHSVCDNGMYRTELIVETYEKGQKQPSNHSCNEMSKTQFLYTTYVVLDYDFEYIIWSFFKWTHLLFYLMLLMDVPQFN